MRTLDPAKPGEGPHQVRWITPVGLSYDSQAPPLLPGATITPPPSTSVIEIHLRRHTHAA